MNTPRRGYKRTGFTLIEMVIGIGLFLVLMTFFLTIIRGSTRESALSSDHFTSSMLSQKVVEDLLEEMEMNPLGMAALGIEESSPLPPSSVTDGNSPFFNYVEDRSPPWGKINAQNEGSINSSLEPLYTQVKSFMVSAIGKKIPIKPTTPENKHLVEANVQFNWKARVGKGNTLSACQLFAPNGAKPASLSFAFDQSEIEQEISTTFFNTGSKTLAQASAESGANYDTVLALGLTHFATKGFLDSTSYQKYLDNVATCKTKAQGSFSSKQNEYIAKQNLAKAYFDLGNACFQMAYVLATQVASLKDHCEPVDLGDVLVDDTDAFTPGLANFRKIVATFVDATAMSRHYYCSLLAPGLSGARGIKQQLFVIRRLLDLNRILSASPDYPNGLSEYRLFLGDLATAMEGRNPYLHRLLLQEKGFAQSETTLIAKHPTLDRVQLVTVKASSVAKDIVQKYPPPP